MFSNITLTETNKKRIEKCFVAFDTETTGLDPNVSDIIELAAIAFENKKRTKGFSTFINPGYHIPAEVTKINHITDEMVSHAPEAAEALTSFIEFLKNINSKEIILVAHNASFDKKFFEAAVTKYNIFVPMKIQFLDTLSISRKRVSETPNYKLGTLIEKFNIENKAPHRAAGDAMACGYLLLTIKDLPEKESYISNKSSSATFTFDMSDKIESAMKKTYKKAKKRSKKNTIGTKICIGIVAIIALIIIF